MNWFKRLFSSSPARKPIRPRTFSYSYPIPERLGVRPELAEDANSLVSRLQESLAETYLQQVRERVKVRHPEIGDAKYGWMELELKRFFLLTAILRHVPMYSDDADLIWHEMLMFTREYQQFSERFAGFYIHHQPNVNPGDGGGDAEVMDARAEERAAFEIVYAALFSLAPETHRLLGPFYRHRMPSALLEEIESGDEERLRAALRVRDSSDIAVTAVQERVLAAVREKTGQARAYHDDSRPGEQSAFYAGADPLWILMAYGLASETMPFDPYALERERQRQQGSSCGLYSDDGTYVDYGNDDGSGGNGDSGGDNGNGGGSCSSSDGGGDSSSCSSSSCSSSSCGSSCGGGGD
ncbi:hypothetical protein [Cohnella candidum]|uniref:Uncharacterized protein n=1 Tax=Cohnella candidum TaxID=2674991 RepID=A0A3G3JZA9_9BACL|nr:hypothetical protein [Cohnella candidum]AYQ73492.1 hypothetical protein EAV92_13440 [Cohnella candidum]